jgi:hypothetical protein
MAEESDKVNEKRYQGLHLKNGIQKAFQLLVE